MGQFHAGYEEMTSLVLRACTLVQAPPGSSILTGG